MKNKNKSRGKAARGTLKWRVMKPWLGAAGLFGAGLLPCPDCGKPMIMHFWPLALLLSLRNLIQQRNKHIELDLEQSHSREISPYEGPE